MFKIPVSKMEKICSRLQNGGIRRLQIREGFRDYKSGQKRLQIGEALWISNWGEKITNRGKEISNWGKRDFKSKQGFEIWAGITHRCGTAGAATCSIKKAFWKSTPKVRRPAGCHFIKKETSTQVFWWKFNEIFQKSFFCRTAPFYCFCSSLM